MKKLISTLLVMLLLISMASAENNLFGITKDTDKYIVVDKIGEIFGKLEKESGKNNSYVIEPDFYRFYGLSVNKVIVKIDENENNWSIELYLTEDNKQVYLSDFEKLYSALIDFFGNPNEYFSTQNVVDLSGNISYEEFNEDTFEKAIRSEKLKSYIIKWENVRIQISLSKNFDRITLNYSN